MCALTSPAAHALRIPVSRPPGRPAPTFCVRGLDARQDLRRVETKSYVLVSESKSRECGIVWSRFGEGAERLALAVDAALVEQPCQVLAQRLGVLPAHRLVRPVAQVGVGVVEIFRAHADEIALVVLDMTMPRMSGAETIRELQRIRPDVRVVFSSGYSQTEAGQAIDEFGAVGFISKPYRVKTFLDTVHEAVAKPPVNASTPNAPQGPA